jgi:hypothetical protein
LPARAIAFRLQNDRARAGADIAAARRMDPDNPLVKEAERVVAADRLIL